LGNSAFHSFVSQDPIFQNTMTANPSTAGGFAPNLRAATHKTWSRITVRALHLGLTFAPLGLIAPVRADNTTPDFDPDAVFIPKHSNSSILASDISVMYELVHLKNWKLRASRIRSGTREQCLGNLSLALAQVGPVYQAEAGGASGALTLLPTAGALIGAPAKELWVLFKLVPLAGVLSMLLSLGGNIVPQTLAEYDKEAFSYGGMIATEEGTNPNFAQDFKLAKTSPQEFAKVVRQRAHNHHGSSKWKIAIIGITAQLCWIAIILVACSLTQSGSVVVWWCQVCRRAALGFSLTTRCSNLY
jgi:hypothetical protein